MLGMTLYHGLEKEKKNAFKRIRAKAEFVEMQLGICSFLWISY